jgi:hypothetical protein
MPFDALNYFLTESAGLNKTASFTSAGPNVLDAGMPPRGIEVKMIVSGTSGTAPTLAANIQESRDNGSTWIDCGTFKNPYALTSNTITGDGEYVAYVHIIPLLGTLGGVVYPRLLRFNAVIGGTTPNFNLIVGFVPTFP